MRNAECRRHSLPQEGDYWLVLQYQKLRFENVNIWKPTQFLIFLYLNSPNTVLCLHEKMFCLHIVFCMLSIAQVAALKLIQSFHIKCFPSWQWTMLYFVLFFLYFKVFYYTYPIWNTKICFIITSSPDKLHWFVNPLPGLIFSFLYFSVNIWTLTCFKLLIIKLQITTC